ncbi:hypothetical protein COT29_00960 [Candidatus Micrarchaeota archaeon CG08_land_8_20_14_0_20_59_11]|nr:MAG: hypothetical protein COT29_00960 [Candidatus Micrarchaeota archaeon CG08_land_8_20_14_0_20_59_11]
MKRGQSALEYLVTYGWAILAIVIIAAVLWYFGIFNPAKWSSSKQCGGFSNFQCIDYNTTADTTYVTLANSAGRPITIDAPTACSDTDIGVSDTFTCEWPVGGTAGTQVDININFTVSGGTTHSETGFVKAS